ncbi:MAG: SagB/ThcOx family dehydrogenase [Anaerolineae bacterium]
MARWLKQDLRYGVSAALLLLALFAAVTGIVANLLDLNDFLLHIYGGYAMSALALVHTVFELPRLLAYARVRMRDGVEREERSRQRDARAGEAEAADEDDGLLRTRRGLLGLLVGGAGGYLLGRVAPDFGEPVEVRDLGLRYHEWSKPGAVSVAEGLLDWGERPASDAKVYPEVPRIELPPADASDGLSALEAIARRRSVRSYAGEPVTLATLSHLLTSADGVTAERGGLRLRAAPSAGALYPIEIYVIVHDVAELAPGLYHYAVHDHVLEVLRQDDLRQESVRLGIMQGFLGEAAFVVVLTAVFQRLRWRYQRRSYRYALLEAGHIGQNVYLAATAMGLGACAVGAFLDDGLNDLLGVDGEGEAALYALSVGTR